jgi:tetratricopeptide (TPR) repeat protein
MLNRIVLAVSLALGVTTLGSVLVLAPQAVQAQDKKDKDEKKKEGPKVSAKVAKPLKAAQDAMGKNDWDTALAKTLEAKGMPELTEYEKYQIEEFLSYIYLKKQDYKNAAVAYDNLLASDQLPPETLVERLKVATPLNFQIQNYPKVIDYGKRWIEAAGAPVADAESLVAQAYYIQDDFPNALTHAQAAIDAARAQGQPVKEPWLQIKLGAQNEADDMTAVAGTLAELVQEFPNHKYWEQLLGVTQQVEETDDRVTLNLYRLMLELDAPRYRLRRDGAARHRGGSAG